MPSCGQSTGKLCIVLAVTLLQSIGSIRAAELTSEAVKESIDRGKRFLATQQRPNGVWEAAVGTNPVSIGATSMAVMALVNSGATPQDPTVKAALDFLRRSHDNRNLHDDIGHYATYQIALELMAFAAAHDGNTDYRRMAENAQKLEAGQVKQGVATGGWGYSLGEGQGSSDNSNAQFAVLALREAVEVGVPVSAETWKRVQRYWEAAQNGDGGWSYQSVGSAGGSHGSMTVAGITSLVICEQMLRSDAGVTPDGTPPCCQGTEPNAPLARGISFFGRTFKVGQNPGYGSSVLYYTYGVERAGRLTGLRFFGDHDWYREGAEYLLAIQHAPGHWVGSGHGEDNPVIATSMALLFLSKGLAPVLINKLKYGPPDPRRKGEVLGNDWNRHRRDVRNLADHISSLPKWQKLLTTQDLDLARAVELGEAKGIDAMLQGSVLFITGEEAPSFNAAELNLLKGYLQAGGFILATPTCTSARFEAGFRATVQQLMPPGEGELKRLTQDHPVFQSEFPLAADSVPLFGTDVGCRTSIMYSPEDLGCLWDYWSKIDPPHRNVSLKARILRATKIGTNVMAYATGREPPTKIDVPRQVVDNTELDNVERGLLQIAQIRHDGGWNAAPRALRRLLQSLNQSAGLAASTKSVDLEFSDPNIFQYPMLYMHGRNKFSIKEAESKQVRKYLERGGVLFADSCCGAKPFDKSFREFIESLYPGKKLVKVAVSHDLFSAKYGTDIRKLKRRISEGDNGSVVRDLEPYIEALEIDGRLAVIYSKYDISCALERQAAGNCEGYLPEEAVKLATNIIQYALLDELRLAAPLGARP
ncbi:MAG: DUF4159 domain-containing protein [Planctomycetes bacterium]|nr:DUF4159 domain-containing protein [Planctomycetota bacterium]